MTDHPQFVMSMYANKIELHSAKSKYYMEETKRLEIVLRQHNKKIKDFEKHSEEYLEIYKVLNNKIEKLQTALKDSANGIERIAFDMKPPNRYTPRFIM